MKNYLTALVLFSASLPASADWHMGKVVQLNAGYDGSTISFRVEGWNRNNCTCQSYWPNQMCLDNSRSTIKFETAMVLSAKARGTAIAFNIDEATCKVIAIYELQ